MKITIDSNEQYGDFEVVIRCPRLDDQIARLVAGLQRLDCKLTGLVGDETHILKSAEVLYIDTADCKTFLYTRTVTYESRLTLTQLEELLEASNFFRAGKSLLINFAHIKSMAPEFSGRIVVTMSNGEKCVVSRMYVGTIRKKLGLEE